MGLVNVALRAGSVKHQLLAHGFSELYGRLWMNTDCTLTSINGHIAVEVTCRSFR